jgi:enolase
MRDKDENRYLGKGVTKAVDNVHKLLAPALKGMNVRD